MYSKAYVMHIDIGVHKFFYKVSKIFRIHLLQNCVGSVMDLVRFRMKLKYKAGKEWLKHTGNRLGWTGRDLEIRGK